MSLFKNLKIPALLLKPLLSIDSLLIILFLLKKSINTINNQQSTMALQKNYEFGMIHQAILAGIDEKKLKKENNDDKKTEDSNQALVDLFSQKTSKTIEHDKGDLEALYRDYIVSKGLYQH